MCQGSTCHVVAQHGDISKLNAALLLTWEVCATIAIKTSKEISQCYVSKRQGKQRQTNKGNICGTKILGTQLFRTTQMCQGSTCRVVAQHGDISKLNKALLLTWEVCATIAIRCHQDIQRDFAMPCSKKHKANQGIPTKATFVTQDSWDTTVDYPDVPMSGFQGTCPNGQPLGSPDSGPVSGSTCLSSSTACLVNRLDKTTLLTWETVHICKFNI